LVTSFLVAFCFIIRRHYVRVRANLNRLDEILSDIPLPETTDVLPVDSRAPTAALFVNSFSGLGIHSFLNIQKQFPSHFRNFIFISVNVVDAGSLKGLNDMNEALKQTEEGLQKYVRMANKLGFAATYRMGVGTEIIDEAAKITQLVHKEFPQAVFFTSKLVFQKERWYQRFLHNETANQLQRKLQFDGLNMMVLPIRVFEKS